MTSALVRKLAFFCFLLCAVLPDAAGQTTGPLKGIVWTPPGDLQQAENDLRRMHRLGVEAIRTDLIRNAQLLDLADTLGLMLFQELPLDAVSAAGLRDTLGYATRLLELALTEAQRHPSARHFGLARGSDTSDPAACTFFEQLAERVRQHGPSGSQAYYVTRFAEADACTDAVDFVLLDVRDAAKPVHRLAQWRAARDSLSAPPAGIGALGTWVRPGTRGIQRPHSLDAQARYLETNLRRLLTADSTAQPLAVFVQRWRDMPTTQPVPTLDLADPFVQRYGLLNAAGEPRPAYQVVEGFFSGRQMVFALDTGRPHRPRAPWTSVMGWGVVLLLGVCFAASARFRQLVPRYFFARLLPRVRSRGP